MQNKPKKFLLDQKGLTTVEYAIAGALVAVALTAAFNSLGLSVGVVIGNMAALLATMAP